MTAQYKKGRPSGYKNIEVCPAFEQDENRPEHAVTAEGTLLHAALETGDLRGLNEDQIRLVEMCRDFVNTVVPEDAVRKNELKLPIAHGDKGTCDLVALKGPVAWLIDYKTGFNLQTPAVDNPQAQAYVLGLFQVFPYLLTVHAYFLYPRIDQISTHTFHRKDANAIVARLTLLKERQAAATPETCNYVPDICVYCKRLGKCPTAARALLPLARKYNEAHDATVLPEVPDFSVVTDPHAWSRLLNAAPIMEAMAESIRHHAREFRLGTGTEIPGWTMRTRKSKASIISPLTAWEVAKEHGVTQEQYLAACTVSAKQLLDAVRENAPRGQKEKKATELENKLCDSGALELGQETQYMAREKS